MTTTLTKTSTKLFGFTSCGLAACIFAISGTVQAADVDFNTAGDLGSNFTETGQASKWTELAGNGIGGSRGITVSTSGNQGQQVFTNAFAGDGSSLLRQHDV